MSENIKQRQQQVNQEIDQTYEALVKRKGEQKTLDDELQALLATRHHYSLLSEICDRLDQLNQEGGGQLFWGDDVDASTASQVAERARATRSSILTRALPNWRNATPMARATSRVCRHRLMF